MSHFLESAMLSALFLSSALLFAPASVEENSGGVGGHLIAGFNACIAACNEKLDKSAKTDNDYAIWLRDKLECDKILQIGYDNKCNCNK